MGSVSLSFIVLKIDSEWKKNSRNWGLESGVKKKPGWHFFSVRLLKALQICFFSLSFNFVLTAISIFCYAVYRCKSKNLILNKNFYCLTL